MPRSTYPFLPAIPKAFVDAVLKYCPFTPSNCEHPQQNNGIWYRKDTSDKVECRCLNLFTLPMSANFPTDTAGKPLFCRWGDGVPHATEYILWSRRLMLVEGGKGRSARVAWVGECHVWLSLTVRLNYVTGWLDPGLDGADSKKGMTGHALGIQLKRTKRMKDEGSK